MANEFDVLAVGDLNVDLVLSECPWPEAGKERLAAGMSFTLGGSAAIFASNLSALGARVAMVARVGADAPGRFVREELAARGVDVSGVRASEELQTGITVVLALPGQEQKAMLTFRGAMESLAESDVPDALLRRARHLHVASYYLLRALHPGCVRLFQRAKAAGLSTSLDTNDDPLERWDGGLPELLAHTDLFFPNRREALSLAGETDLRLAAQKLAERGRVVAVKADADGALLCGKGTPDCSGAPKGQSSSASGDKLFLQIPAVPVKFVESTGAGDSFDAGFLLRYLAGAPLEECLRFANACGALAVTASGGTEAFRGPGVLEKIKALAEWKP